MSDFLLRTRRLNHGQSEVCLERDGKSGPFRTVATNRVLQVVKQYSQSSEYTEFVGQYGEHVGKESTVASDAEAMGRELNLSL